MNVIIGGGDTGKTTILEAIGLLLSPSNSTIVSESDYWQRDASEEFCIDGVFSLPESSEMSTQPKFAWPWNWDGQNAVLPTDVGGDADAPPDNPVYWFRLRGTTELELLWELVQPNGDADSLTTGIRRAVGLVRLSGDDRNDRDLRLVYGSALDRLFSDVSLRARIGKEVSKIDLNAPLGDDGRESIDDLSARFEKASLPHGLSLGLTTTHGLSIGALIGLHAEKDDTDLPLSSWGAGTRRMAALETASVNRTNTSIAAIDEIERGLEPYRLRKLIGSVIGSFCQSFVTTHSAVAIACTEKADLWYLDSCGQIGPLPRHKIEQQQRRDPETFLSRVAVIAEGATEVGFLRYLLECAFSGEPLDRGVRVCDGQGNDATLGLLEALSSSGLLFCGLADNEGRNPERWKALKDQLGDALLQWPTGCTEEQVIANIPDDQLGKLVTDTDGAEDGLRLRTLADRLGSQDKSLDKIRQALDATGTSLRTLIIAAATGDKDGAPEGSEKEWKAHARCWFKSEAGGRELAKRMLSGGAWPNLRPSLMPLINAVLRASEMQERDDLQP